MTLLGLDGASRLICILAACSLLAAFLLACNTDDETGERLLLLEADADALEETIEALQEENASLKQEIATLRQTQTAFVPSRAASTAIREYREEEADFEEVQEQQLADLETGQQRSDERLDDLNVRLQELEEVARQIEFVLPGIAKWTSGMDKRMKLLEGTHRERTTSLAETAGAEVYHIDHHEREESAVLVMPLEPIDGNPLIVSLHGFGGNSADHSLYIPLHEHVTSRGFGLLLVNGSENADGQRFWNPTDPDSDFSKTSVDDVAYLTDVVKGALKVKDFGPVYFFGYSNGGFMAYHMACKGLPGLRAVASLAGTSYAEESACEGAPPVSVLHIHGTDDSVVVYEGERSESIENKDGTPAFYAGAEEMLSRWGRRAGCDSPGDPRPYSTFDLDQHVPGAETQAFRLESGCVEGITLELWKGEGSSHSPAYGDAFVDALLDWLLSR